MYREKKGIFFHFFYYFFYFGMLVYRQNLECWFVLLHLSFFKLNRLYLSNRVQYKYTILPSKFLLMSNFQHSFRTKLSVLYSISTVHNTYTFILFSRSVSSFVDFYLNLDSIADLRWKIGIQYDDSTINRFCIDLSNHVEDHRLAIFKYEFSHEMEKVEKNRQQHEI